MSFSVIIPARLASTRLPNKPLALINGVPMVVRVAQQARQSLASRIIVACDDLLIEEACKNYGIQACLTSKDCACGTDRLSEVVDKLNIPNEEIIVNVQGDEPLIPVDIINMVAEILQKNSDCAMGTAAIRIKSAEEFFNPNVVKVELNKKQEALTFSRAPLPWDRDNFAKTKEQIPEDLALRHVGIYSYRAGFLKVYPKLEKSPIETVESLEQLRALWHGYKIGVEIFDKEIPPGVDTPEDLERVRKHFSAANG